MIEDDVTEFFSVIQQRIDPNIQMDDLHASALSKSQYYVNFEENHCPTTTYTFQIKIYKNCRDVGYNKCSLDPLLLPQKSFQLSSLYVCSNINSIKQLFS